MTGYLAELRRGPGVWLAPVLLAVAVLYGISVFETFAIWSYTDELIANAPRMTGPIVMGVAAWLGARGRRHNLTHLERLSRRGAVGAAASEMAALLTWVALAHIVFAGAAIAVTAFRASWGGPSWSWQVASLAGLLALVPLGWLIGRLQPWRFTPFLVSICSFALITYVDNAVRVGWTRLLPVNIRYFTPFEEPWAKPLYGQAIWYLGLSAGVLLVIAIADRASVRLIGGLGVVALAALAAGAPLALSKGRSFADDTRGFVYECAGRVAEICVHPAYRSSLKDLAARGDQVAERLRGTGFEFRRAEQQLRGGAGALNPGVIAFGFDSPEATNLDIAAEEMAMAALDAAAACFREGQPPREGRHAVFLVISWAAGNELSDVLRERTAAWDWLTSQPTGQARLWVRANADKIRNCSLSYADFR